jgi:hypothetical protein
MIFLYISIGILRLFGLKTIRPHLPGDCADEATVLDPGFGDRVGDIVFEGPHLRESAQLSLGILGWLIMGRG